MFIFRSVSMVIFMATYLTCRANENKAATKIQSQVRGHLERKKQAKKKAATKIQSLMRGHLIRKKGRFYDVHKIKEIHKHVKGMDSIRIAIIEKDFRGNAKDTPDLIDMSKVNLFEATNYQSYINIEGIKSTNLGNYLPSEDLKKLPFPSPSDLNDMLFTYKNREEKISWSHANMVMAVYNGEKTNYFPGGIVKGGKANIYHFDRVQSTLFYRGMLPQAVKLIMKRGLLF